MYIKILDRDIKRNSIDSYIALVYYTSSTGKRGEKDNGL